MKPKPTFVTSDWHIGHANSIKFDNRPFRSVEHMHEVLIKNYLTTVPIDGICYFLGDINVSSVEKSREVISKLHGTKILILGNHDGNPTSAYNAGFDVVMYGGVVYINGHRVTMSHCPLKGVFREDLKHIPLHKQKDPPENWHGETRDGFGKFTFTDEGQYHLHGHIHARKDTPAKSPILDRQFDVGVPANHYRPVSFSQIESWIMKHKLGRV